MLFETSQIEAALAVLAGLPLWDCTRALDMQMFSFGAKVTRISRFGPRKGQEQIVGEWALHVQCAWHVAGPEGVIVGSRDRYEPVDESVDVDAAWDWKPPGANLCDARTAAWMARGPYRVDHVSVTAIGGLTIELERGHRLEVFIDSSNSGERWRFFKPAGSDAHLVVTGDGFDR